MCQWVFQERHTSTLASDLLYQRGIGHSGHGDSPLPTGQADDSNLFTPTPTLTLPHQGGGELLLFSWSVGDNTIM